MYSIASINSILTLMKSIWRCKFSLCMLVKIQSYIYIYCAYWKQCLTLLQYNSLCALNNHSVNNGMTTLRGKWNTREGNSASCVNHCERGEVFIIKIWLSCKASTGGIATPSYHACFRLLTNSLLQTAYPRLLQAALTSMLALMHVTVFTACRQPAPVNSVILCYAIYGLQMRQI